MAGNPIHISLKTYKLLCHQEEKKAHILEALIADSEATFGYKSERFDHPSGLPELTKYYYVHSEGKRTKQASRSSTTISTSGALGKEAMGKLALTGRDGGVTQVKVENPEHLEVKDKLKTMSSGKKQLDQMVSKGESMLALLKAKMAKNEPNSRKAYDDLNACAGTLKKFISDFADMMGTAECLTSSDDCSGMPAKMQDMINRAVIHADGAKSMLKRYNSTWRPE
jgi:hypothetical protein